MSLLLVVVGVLSLFSLLSYGFRVQPKIIAAKQSTALKMVDAPTAVLGMVAATAGIFAVFNIENPVVKINHFCFFFFVFPLYFISLFRRLFSLLSLLVSLFSLLLLSRFFLFSLLLFTRFSLFSLLLFSRFSSCEICASVVHCYIALLHIPYTVLPYSNTTSGPHGSWKGVSQATANRRSEGEGHHGEAGGSQRRPLPVPHLRGGRRGRFRNHSGRQEEVWRLRLKKSSERERARALNDRMKKKKQSKAIC